MNRKIISSKCQSKESWRGYTRTDKVDFRAKKIARNKEYYITIKGSICEEDITTLNVYVPNK